MRPRTLQYFLSLVLYATGCCAGAESKLHGSWKSDLKRTSDYLLKYAKLSEHQKKSFNMLFGRSVITFNADGTGTIAKEPFSIQTEGGGRLPMSGSTSSFSYTVVGESEGQVVVRFITEDPATTKCPFVVMKFESKDGYSIEIGDNNFDLSGREFFQRSETKAEPGGAGQPATRPESKAEDKSKPQPESKLAPQ